MRKKYLSALLFGALLFASAGTFTSCKDYDDDIDGLREDVTSLQNAVTTLQNAVENGKYVSAVSNNGNTITFTFTDGTTTDITLEDEKGSVVTVNADGVLCIDGEPTDIKAATDPTPGEEQKDQIIIENNMWSVLQEDGTYKSTGIPVSGINVAGSEADGYTFTIYAADGSSQTVKLPSAASSITEMTLGREVSTYGESYTFGKTASTTGTTFNGGISDVLISHVEFDYDNLDANIDNFKASDWKGNKKLPNDGDFIYSSPTKIDLRMDPVDVPANNIKFYLTNTKNEDLEPVVLAASASQDSNNGPMGTEDINSRAAVTGNGLWTLSMANQTVAKDDNEDVWDIIGDAETNKVDNDDPNSDANPYVYALNANHGFRSEYKLTVKRIDPEELTYLTMEGVNPAGTAKSTFSTDTDNNPATKDLNGTYDTDNTNTTFKVGVPYKVNANAASALYDMYLTADASDIEVYGLTFDQDAHTFTIGKNPDVSTVPADFDLIVYTVANDGTVNKATITVRINTEISAAAEYSLHEHDVNKANNSNYFSIDLATMKTSLGDNLNQWIQNVNLGLTEIKWSEKADMSNASILNAIDATPSASGVSGIQASVVEALTKKDDDKHKATTDRNKANFIQIDVENADVNGLKLDKTYYIQATFYTGTTTDMQILNSIVVPVEFHAPKLADLFTKKSLYVVDDVINAYFYKVEGVIADGHKYQKDALTVNLDRYFSAFVADAKVKFADGNVGETGKKATDLFVWSTFEEANESNTTNSNFKDVDNDGTNEQVFATTNKDNKLTHSTTLGFNSANDGIKSGKPANGYGEVLTIEVNKSFYNNTYDTAVNALTNHGWVYTQDGDDKYSFQIRLMSPIYEGGVKPVTGSAITIAANDLAKGASITSDMISGYDYNNVPFSAVPDVANGHTKPEVIYDESMTPPSTPDNTYVSAADYEHAQIETIIPSVDKDNYIQYVEIISAYDNEGTTVPGEFKVYGTSTSVTGTVNMPVTVTDAWGYVLEDEVPITIQKND